MSATGTAEKHASYSSFEYFTRENEVAGNEMYLSFRLADNDFGIKVAYVVEIIGMKRVTKMPQTPIFVSGAIDYRGGMIFVIDLRVYLDLPPRPESGFALIVVIEYQNVQVGLIVDKVNEVRPARKEELIPVCSRYGKGKTAR